MKRVRWTCSKKDYFLGQRSEYLTGRLNTPRPRCEPPSERRSTLQYFTAQHSVSSVPSVSPVQAFSNRARELHSTLFANWH
jgi:hypothetical protein